MLGVDIKTDLVFVSLLFVIVALAVLLRDLLRVYVEPFAAMGRCDKAMRALGGEIASFSSKELVQKLRLAGLPDRDAQMLAGWRAINASDFDKNLAFWVFSGLLAAGAVSSLSEVGAQNGAARARSVEDDDDAYNFPCCPDPSNPASYYYDIIPTNIGSSSHDF